MGGQHGGGSPLPRGREGGVASLIADPWWGDFDGDILGALLIVLNEKNIKN